MNEEKQGGEREIARADVWHQAAAFAAWLDETAEPERTLADAFMDGWVAALASRRSTEADQQKPPPCGAYSNGTDGWCCAATGPHDQHHNAAGDVRWGDA